MCIWDQFLDRLDSLLEYGLPGLRLRPLLGIVLCPDDLEAFWKDWKELSRLMPAISEVAVA